MEGARPAAEGPVEPEGLPGAPQGDVSREAYRLARMVDGICRLQGRYVVLLTIPANRRSPWVIEVSRLEPLQRK